MIQTSDNILHIQTPVLIQLNTRLILIFLLWRRSTWLQHLLEHVELDPGLALVLGDGEVVGEVLMTHQRGEGVPVLVNCPLELGGVCVTSALVFGLEMLHLRQNVESVSHPELLTCLSCRSESSNIS